MHLMLRNTILILALVANAALAVGSPICCLAPSDCCGMGNEPVAADAPSVSCCSHCPAPTKDETPVASGLPCSCHPSDHAVLAHFDVPVPELALALATPRTDYAVADLVGAATAPHARSVRSACAGRTPPLRL